jgi:uncharacterized protein
MSLTPALAPSAALAGFAALLRDHGLSVGVAEQQAMLRAALVLGALEGPRLGAAWRAIACHGVREWRLWPELFERYWHPQRLRGTVRVSGQMRPARDLRQSVRQMHEQLEATQAPNVRMKSAPHTAADAPITSVGDQPGGIARAMGGASAHEPQIEALHQRDGQMWLPQELGTLARLARQITAQLRPLPTRRWRQAQPGRRLDLRQTLRNSVAWGGEPMAPTWQMRRTHPPRLFILTDVSRSMESHAALFLRIARAFALQAHARVFIFHTRLAEITPLMQRDSATVQEKINAVTAGFGSGTRIAQSLQNFTRVHARAQLRRGARVWIMSDGFDADSPQELALALSALRGHGASITWFHPTRGIPAAAAVQNARDHVHRFVPLANLADLATARALLH